MTDQRTRLSGLQARLLARHEAERIELEALEKEERTLEARAETASRALLKSRLALVELQLEHAPEFLARRSAARTAVDEARAKFAEVERQLLAAGEDEGAAAAQVGRMGLELKSLERQRVSGLVTVLLPVAVVVVAVALIDGLPPGPVAFCCGLGLGLVFGVRVHSQPQPRRPIAPNLTRSLHENVWRNKGALPLLFSVFSVLAASATWDVIPDEVRFSRALVVQGLAWLSVGSALVMRRRIERHGGGGRLTTLAAVAVGLSAFVGLAWTWVPEIQYLLQRFPWFRIELFFLPLTSLIAIPALALAAIAQWIPSTRRPMLLASFAFAVLAIALAAAILMTDPRFEHQLSDSAGTWCVVQAVAGALLLGWTSRHRAIKQGIPSPDPLPRRGEGNL